MPSQIKKQTMEERKKFYIIPPLNSTFFPLFEEKDLHFRFALDPANDIADSILE